MGWFNHQLVTVKQCRAPKYTGPEILQKGELCGGVYLRSAQNAQIFSILRVFQLQRRYGIFTLPKTNIFVLKSPFPLGSLEIPNLETTNFRCDKNVSFREGSHTWLEFVVLGTLTSWKWTFFREKLGETVNVAGDAIWPSNPSLRGHLLGCPRYLVTRLFHPNISRLDTSPK